MLIDTHAHLYWEDYKEDLNQVIQRSIENGVTTIINVGVDVELSKKALQQAQDFDGESFDPELKTEGLSRTGKLNSISGLNTYSTIGIHPHEAIKYPDNVSIHKDISELEQLYQSSPDYIIAVGECGLDYFLQEEFMKLPDGTPLSENEVKNMQRKLFQAQIDMANKLSLPLLVHCRDDRSKDSQSSEAWDEVLKMVGNHPAVLHCYSGTTITTRKVLSCPTLFVSFAANITYPKNEYLREAVKILPLDRILFETDSPFLAPQSKRGQRNEPSSVREIAELVAELKGVSFKKVAEQSTVNAKQIFQLR